MNVQFIERGNDFATRPFVKSCEFFFILLQTKRQHVRVDVQFAN